MSEKVQQFFKNSPRIFVQQVREMLEIFVGIEGKNKYEVLDDSGNKIGFMAESGGGLFKFLSRNFLRSHRPLKIKVWNNAQETVLTMERPFFFFFSDLEIKGSDGRACGHVHRRFAIIHKMYDLVDDRGVVFARVKAPIWRLWTFPILDGRDNPIGEISKSWGGFLKEVFTDSDKFQVSFPPELTDSQKAVTFGAAISIDMDFFENNQGSGSLLDLVD